MRGQNRYTAGREICIVGEKERAFTLGNFDEELIVQIRLAGSEVSQNLIQRATREGVINLRSEFDNLFGGMSCSRRDSWEVC